jgi:hypothetical protein
MKASRIFFAASGWFFAAQAKDVHVVVPAHQVRDLFIEACRRGRREILLAAMQMPTPLVQTSRPSSAWPAATACAPGCGEIGIIVGRVFDVSRRNR